MQSLELDTNSQVLGSTQDSAGQIIVQTGSAAIGLVNDDNAPVWGPGGFVSRPMPPTANGRAAECVGITNTDEPQVLAIRDLRKAAPAVQPGEVAAYCTHPGSTSTIHLAESTVTITVGNNTIVADSQKVTITAGGNTVVVSSAGVELAGGADFVALAAKVDANFSALQATLASGANSGGPVAFTVPFLPSTTAAVKTKGT